MNTLVTLQQVKIELNNTMKYTDYDGTAKTETVLYAFNDEVPEAVERVMTIVETHLGKEEQYLFWYLMEALSCPTAADTAHSILKPFRDLNLLETKHD